MPECSLKPWDKGVTLKLNQNVPWAFVMPGTSKDVLATRWSCTRKEAKKKAREKANKDRQKEIIIVQQNPSVDYEGKKFNDGKPAIIVPLNNERYGFRTIWGKWDPVVRRQRMTSKGGRGLLIHHTTRNDQSYTEHPEVLRRRGLLKSKAEDRKRTKKQGGDRQSLEYLFSPKRQRTMVQPDGEPDCEEEEIRSSPQLSPPIGRERPRIQVPTSPTTLVTEATPETIGSLPPADVFFAFNGFVVNTKAVTSNQLFFKFATASGVATGSTRLLCATFDGKKVYAMRNQPVYFQENVLPFIRSIAAREGDDQDNALARRIDVTDETIH